MDGLKVGSEIGGVAIDRSECLLFFFFGTCEGEGCLQGVTLSGILLGFDLGKGNTVEQGREKESLVMLI